MKTGIGAPIYYFTYSTAGMQQKKDEEHLKNVTLKIVTAGSAKRKQTPFASLEKTRSSAPGI